MNMHSFKLFSAGLTTVVVLLSLNSCSDTWNNHYETNFGINSDKTLWEKMEAQSNLSDFRSILEATKVSSYNNVSTVSFAELLNSDQTFTVWAPVNGTFNKDSLLNLCQTDSGQRVVEKCFVKNHIARFLHSVTSTTDEGIMLLNRKEKILKGFAFGNVTITDPNILGSNGLLHILNGEVPYLSNIYEEVNSNSEYSKLSAFLKAYQKDSLDEFSSVSSGIVDGKTIYVDSVLIAKNPLLDELGYINEEDSAYWMVAPTDGAWVEAYNKILPYYNFSFIPNAINLQDYWTKHALLNDLIFNSNWQTSTNDSLVATSYKINTPLQHVFQKPFESGGILSNVKGNIICSNGSLFKVDTWPYAFQKTFFSPLISEAELESNILSTSTATIMNTRSVQSKGLSNDGYLDIKPTSTSTNPEITFQVKNTLSGKYDVCIVFAPKTVYETPLTKADSLRVFNPCKFRSTLYYADAKGLTQYKNLGTTGIFYSNPNKLDTVVVAPGFKFPTCNLNQLVVTVSLKITGFVMPSETNKYNREMYIDCVYLKPRED